jgi:hypothetical protein
VEEKRTEPPRPTHNKDQEKKLEKEKRRKVKQNPWYPRCSDGSGRKYKRFNTNQTEKPIPVPQ